jgi:hypothetical protein
MGVFLWLSDLHLDPYYGTPKAASSHKDDCTRNKSTYLLPYGQMGCDAPMLLIHETLEQARSTVSPGEIEFILITGDFARHQTDMLDDGIEEAKEILLTISGVLQTFFPSTPVLPTTGNNDFVPDYALNLEVEGSGNESLNISLQGFQDLLSESEQETFSKGGYFARNISDSLTVLSLNTVMYSVNHQPDQTYLEDPMGQLAWMDSQLKMASDANRICYIVGHIPPTIGSYRHSQFWHEQYVDRYFDILVRYPDSIKGHLFGHLHSEEFRLLRPPSKTEVAPPVPLYIASSVTPVYGANPSYRLVEYDSITNDLLDYRTVFLDLEATYRDENMSPVWIHGPGFTEIYGGLPDLSSDSLQQLLSALAGSSGPSDDDDETWKTFLERQYVYSSGSLDAASCDAVCRLDWICTLQAVSKEDYTTCIGPSGGFQKNGTVVAGAMVAGVAAVAVGGCVFWQRNRRRRRRRHFSEILQAEEEEAADGSVRGEIETGSHDVGKKSSSDAKGELA